MGAGSSGILRAITQLDTKCLSDLPSKETSFEGRGLIPLVVI